MAYMTQREKKTANIKEEIISSIDALFVSYGTKGITLSNISKDSGVSTGSIQHHFGSKEQILQAYGYRVFERMLADFSRQLIPTFERGPLYTVALPFALYAYYCQIMGKDFIRASYSFEQDIFKTLCFEQHVVPAIEQAQKRNAITTDPNSVKKIIEDITVIFRSTILYWSTSSDHTLPLPLDLMLLRLLKKFLFENRNHIDVPDPVINDISDQVFPWSKATRKAIRDEAAAKGGILLVDNFCVPASD